MEKIIVIQASDPDGRVFRSIMGALQGEDIQILHAADLDPSALTLGDIEIFPEQRRVTKAGIVIRTSDPDGSVFRSILGALQGKDVQALHAADLDPSALTLGDIEIFPEQRRVTKAGVEICLNYGEFSILYCMARCPGRVFSREQLYNAAWGEDYELGTNTVDNTIWRLRNKLEPDPKHPTYIKTVFRVGYKIEK